jgi:hypothetical protein
MQALFSSLVAASLLIHAAIGCCWHHSHNGLCADDRQCQPTSDACAHHHGCCNGQHDQPTQEPCGGHQCHGLCNYLPIQKSQVDDLKLQLPLDFAAILPATCDMQGVAVHHAVGCSKAACEPPVRLHLLHQILLI